MVQSQDNKVHRRHIYNMVGLHVCHAFFYFLILTKARDWAVYLSLEVVNQCEGGWAAFGVAREWSKDIQVRSGFAGQKGGNIDI